MRTENIKLYSINGSVLRHVSLREAFAMLANEQWAPVKNTRREIVAVQMKHLERNEKPSACTLTRSDMVNNAEGAAHPHERRRSRHKAIDQIGNYIDRAMTKVEEWGPTHDEKAAIVSAGVIYGVFCSWPPQEERVVTFA